MNIISIRWEDECYIVYEEDDFIGDFPDLMAAAKFALEVSSHSGMRVVIESIAP